MELLLPQTWLRNMLGMWFPAVSLENAKGIPRKDAVLKAADDVLKPLQDFSMLTPPPDKG